MIPKQDLEKLKPLPDIVKRNQNIKRKYNKHNSKKFHLTKRARQWAWFGSSGLRVMKDYSGPKGDKCMGLLSMEKRRKVSKNG